MVNKLGPKVAALVEGRGGGRAGIYSGKAAHLERVFDAQQALALEL